MEQTEVYKIAQAKINDLEKQLSICGNIANYEKSAKEAENQIEEHFARCLSALAQRKATLLDEVAQQVALQKEKAKGAHTTLATALETCQATVKAATLMYKLNPNGAEPMLKEINNISASPILETRVTVSLPPSLLNAIETFGKVHTSNSGHQFSCADNVTTLAGSVAGKTDGNRLNASFTNPWGMCLNTEDDCLYICDTSNNAIRKLTMQGDLTTFVKSDAKLNSPRGIAMNYKENMLYVATNNRISKVTPSGQLQDFAGNETAGYQDGMGVNVRFSCITGITIDHNTSNIFVCDHNNHVIRKITPQGNVSTLAGSGTVGFADGIGNNAMFHNPCGLCFDVVTESLIVCDYNNHKVRKVLLNGKVTTLCEIKSPIDVKIVHNTLLVSSATANQIYKVTQKGQNYEVAVLAGSGKKGREDGKLNECSFSLPYGIAVHEASNSCFVSEFSNHLIRKISFSDM